MNAKRTTQNANTQTRRREGREGMIHDVLRDLRAFASALPFAFCVLSFALGSSASAQAINHDETRLLSAPNGRPGCYAPLQVVFDAPDGVKSALVESISEGVVLTRQVNIDKPGRITTRMPWLVAKGSKVRVTIAGQSDEFAPPMPSRPQTPGYGRIYAAVFTPDIAKARELLPPGDDLTCDFYSDREEIEDWRLLDGYDAMILLAAHQLKWPEPIQLSVDRFLSLGGVFLSDFLLPVGGPGEGEKIDCGGVQCQHATYGAGGSYRFEYDHWAKSTSPRSVVIAACRDHRWRGNDMPPSGPAPSRAVAEPFERGWLHPQGQEPPSAPAWFFALAGLVLLLTLLGPIVGARLTSRAWVAPLTIALGATALCWLGSLQSGPPATVEVFTVESRGGEIASTRSYVTCEDIPGAPAVWTINLDAEGPRRLVRPAPARLGCRAWVVDTPMTKPLEAGNAVDLREGKIEDLIFRDYAAKARRGQAHFDEGQARILDWWLEANAYRGRDARLAPATPADEPLADWANVYWRKRGAITVTPLRK
ncbi:hypothetical protein PLCT1_01583 [Planctomycetaceae bacterium]|nr:hypothetical protein PLCT1_01583 [Planctomycetaceae bacterium]